MSANMAELMNGGEATENRPVTDMDMPSQRGVIGENAMIANDAIVGDMDICHEQVMTANAGFVSILHRAAMHGAGLTEHVVIPNDRTRRFALVLLVLVRFTNGTE